MILGIETSCDDSSVALVDLDGKVVDLQSYTKDKDHEIFGGIVPERASRNHLKFLVPLISNLLKKNSIQPQALKAIAVTSRPGLQGSLIVGVVTAKTLSLLYGLPIIGINHLEGHIYSSFVGQSTGIPFPHISLIVSGGHTQLVLVKGIGQYDILGKTVDDAAGEAIDKFSNSVGLGFPGGAKVDEYARKGDSKKYSFPRPMLNTLGYEFSFSGLKAAGNRKIEEVGKSQLSSQVVSDLCASYLEAVTEVLFYKLKKTLQEFKPKAFSVVGGVSANSVLRKKLEGLSKDMEIPFYKPELKYCTDNGAMIAYAGLLRFNKGLINSPLEIKTSARSIQGDFNEYSGS